MLLLIWLDLCLTFCCMFSTCPMYFLLLLFLCSFFTAFFCRRIFPLHHIKSTYYQCDLSLLMSTFITLLRLSLSGFSIAKLFFFSYPFLAIFLRSRSLCIAHIWVELLLYLFEFKVCTPIIHLSSSLIWFSIIYLYQEGLMVIYLYFLIYNTTLLCSSCSSFGFWELF